MNNPGTSGTISVIVPVYNVEEYLLRCLESILGQTYRDLQVILVDDGSTDGSSRLCAEFAERDPRIECIRISNSGVSAARNRGLEAAKGRWIGFVDADDYIEAGFYETLVTHLTHSDKQIVCCGVRAEDTEGNRIERFKGRRFPAGEQDFDRDDALLRYLNPDTRILYWAVWNKLYSAELLNIGFWKMLSDRALTTRSPSFPSNPQRAWRAANRPSMPLMITARSLGLMVPQANVSISSASPNFQRARSSANFVYQILWHI